MDRIYFAAGAHSALLGVAAGAIVYNAMKGRLDAEMLAVFEVGVRYQMYHALALLMTAWAATKWPGTATTAGGMLFIDGTVIFSVSLYLLSLSGLKWLGAVTPIGGAQPFK